MSERRSLPTEPKAQGGQFLFPGVRPLTLRQHLALLTAAPLAPRAAQKPPNIGLFDDDARNQLSLF